MHSVSNQKTSFGVFLNTYSTKMEFSSQEKKKKKKSCPKCLDLFGHKGMDGLAQCDEI